MDTDVEQLRLLSIFHYIVGALAALFALFPTIHLVIGISMVTGRFDDASDLSEAFGPELFGWFFILFALAFIVAGLAFAGCLIAAGRFLASQTHYTFCFVVAALACAFMPFGTILGVFTIIVLQRPSVKGLFGRGVPPAPPPSASGESSPSTSPGTP
jgi:hypothetical protein